MGRIRNLAINTLLVVFSVCVTLMLCEVGFRAYIWIVDPYSSGGRAPLFAEVRSDRVYGYQKNNRRLETNSQGFRGGEFSIREDELRVVMLGDSLTAAMELPNKDTVPSNLELVLNSELEQGVSVSNLGVSGYNSSQSFATLNDVGLALKPDIVVLNFCLNDSDPVLRRHKRGLIVTAEITKFSDINLRTIVGSSYVLTFLKKRLITFINSSDPKFVAMLNDPQLVINQRVSENAWSEMKEYVRKMHEVAVANDISFLVAIYPYASQIGLPPSELLPQRDMEAFLKRHGIQYVDLAETYGQSEEEMFIDRSLHLNPHGTRTVAEVLAKEINQRYLAKVGAIE